ncbi:NADH-quinone oxidoreductase subunit C [Shigella flexneri]
MTGNWRFLKETAEPYVMLFDLHGMDERLRTHREGLPAADFSVFYHLISIDRNRDIMLKVALAEKRPARTALHQTVPER